MPKKILVIDDEELIIKSLSKLLEKKGYEVFIAKKGQDALIMVEEESFDLIIADIRMPGMNGVETIKQIFNYLEKKKLDRMRLIFITGYANEEVRQEALRLNPFDYIFKPFDNLVLLNKIEKALNNESDKS